jgi:hypothetical protein
MVRWTFMNEQALKEIFPLSVEISSYSEENFLKVTLHTYYTDGGVGISNPSSPKRTKTIHKWSLPALPHSPRPLIQQTQLLCISQPAHKTMLHVTMPL